MTDIKSDADILNEINDSVVDKIADDPSKKQDTPAGSKEGEGASEKKEEPKPADQGADAPKDNKGDESKKDDLDKNKPDENDKKPGTEEKKKRPERFIPQDQYNMRKEKWEVALKEKDTQIEELKKKIEASVDPLKSKEEKVEADAEIEVLASELGIEAKDLVKIKKVLTKDLPTISEEDRKLLDDLKGRSKQKTQEDLDKQEAEYYNNEWGTFAPEVDKQYPKATDKQKEEAKKLMHELSHTEKYGKLSLDQIFTLEKKEFDEILFVPQRKTFESGSGGNPADDGDGSEKNILDMTPNELKRHEDKYRDSMPKDTVQVSRNGHVTLE